MTWYLYILALRTNLKFSADDTEGDGAFTR